MRYYVTEPIPCPYCGAGIQYHGDISDDNDPPEDGNYSYCIHCRRLSKYVLTPDLSLAAITPEEESHAWSEQPLLREVILNAEQRRDAKNVSRD